MAPLKVSSWWRGIRRKDNTPKLNEQCYCPASFLGEGSGSELRPDLADTVWRNRAKISCPPADLALKERSLIMSLSISSVPITQPVIAANSGAAAAPPPAPQKVRQPAQSAGPDTVTLTAAQQVFQLYNQGQTVTQIATSLSLSVSLVNNYLGINASGG
jgi:hypothetical protein